MPNLEFYYTKAHDLKLDEIVIFMLFFIYKYPDLSVWLLASITILVQKRLDSNPEHYF
jgi:hypothetical protein